MGESASEVEIAEAGLGVLADGVPLENVAGDSGGDRTRGKAQATAACVDGWVTTYRSWTVRGG